jgi:hypothetical protein
VSSGFDFDPTLRKEGESFHARYFLNASITEIKTAGTKAATAKDVTRIERLERMTSQ